MAKPGIFSQPHLAFIRQLYMRQMMQPASICDAINAKYGTTYAVQQIRRVINTRGWSKRRRNMVEKLGPVEAKKDSAIAREVVNAHSRVMDSVAKGTSIGLERAMRMVEQADNPRTLQAAASAAKSLFSTFRVAAGIDNSSNARGPANFSINFANVDLRAVPSVEIRAEPAPGDAAADLLEDASPDDGEDDASEV